MKKVLIALITVALTGCGTVTNRASVDLLPNAEFHSDHNGIVVFSTGAPEHCIATATFVNVFDAKTKKLVPGTPNISMDVYAVKSDFADHHGVVSALSLPAGSYYLSPRIANPYVTAVKTPAFGFDVVEGGTTYLGELFMTRSCGMNTRFVIRDEYDRDLELASKRNSAFSQRPVVKRLLHPLPPLTANNGS